MTAPPNPITPKLFHFLRDLARHNERDWFNANKARYLAEVRDPLLEFVAAFAPELARISRCMVADPSPVGGSLFRIYRDTRFAKDKSPYKTHAGLSFRHADGRDVHGHIAGRGRYRKGGNGVGADGVEGEHQAVLSQK